MERFNPFITDNNTVDESLAANKNSTSPRNNYFPTSPQAVRQHEAASRTDSSASLTSSPSSSCRNDSASLASNRQQIGLTTSADTVIVHQSSSNNSSRYSTNFPDPFGAETTSKTMFTESFLTNNKQSPSNTNASSIISGSAAREQKQASNRSNSVTFASTSPGVDNLPSPQLNASPTTTTTAAAAAGTRSRLSERGQSTTTASSSGGLTSFLSRATSVTSSSVTDRVSGAVGSVRSAVDSISSQIQQAVPANLNERISSATGQFTSSVVGSSSTSSHMMPSAIISRQRVVLILDSLNNTDWVQQFNNYRRLALSGGLGSGSGSAGAGGGTGSGGSGSGSAQSTITSFFSSATAQLSLSTGQSQQINNVISCGDGLELLIEQADFRDVSVLANQITSTATIIVATNQQRSSLASLMMSPNINPSSLSSHNQSTQTISNNKQLLQQAGCKIIRPEYVVVRQKTKDLDVESVEHLKGIVKGLNYCLIPMFEQIEIWSIFQDRQFLFSKLLKIQKSLGKENFPLIQQIYFQTYQDLLNYSNTSIITFPCLLRFGSIGKGKLKINNLQMLKDFSSIVATSGMSCTIEQYLEVKCDLIIQKIGSSLKIFKRNLENNININIEQQQQQQQQQRQSASRQTSLGSSVISSIISSTTSQQQQQQHDSLDRKNSYSQHAGFERLSSEVGARYRAWIEAISREFDNSLEAFCLKIAIATNDREYIVGLTNCSNNFMATQENQDEDRRSFVELIINNINSNISNKASGNNNNSNNRQSVSRTNSSGLVCDDDYFRTNMNKQNSPLIGGGSFSLSQQNEHYNQIQSKDKKKFLSQSQMINNNKNSNINPSTTTTTTTGNQQQLRFNDKDFSSQGAKNFNQLGNRSQSVSVNQSDYYSKGNIMNSNDDNQNSTTMNAPYFVRRGSDRSDSFHITGTGTSCNDFDEDLSDCLTGTPTPSTYSSSGGGLHQRQTSLGQSFFDQTSTALSSFQKQSMSFFKRLDARGAGELGSTPPQSAKSDKAFDRSFLNNNNNTINDDDTINSAHIISTNNNNSNRNNIGFKSQSIDSSSMMDSLAGGGRSQTGVAGTRRSPPKPPPPPSILSASTFGSSNVIGTSATQRQSSLASYSTGARAGQQGAATGTPNTTPTQTRQNSTVVSSSDSTGGNQTKTKVVRQNSALSAFEPYDPDVAVHLRGSTDSLQHSKQAATEPSDQMNQSSFAKSSNDNTQMGLQQQQQQPHLQKQFDSVKRSSNFDSASITSGDSNSTGETTTAEDTMNNLKKTFASIFGDRCE